MKGIYTIIAILVINACYAQKRKNLVYHAKFEDFKSSFYYTRTPDTNNNCISLLLFDDGDYSFAESISSSIKGILKPNNKYRIEITLKRDYKYGVKSQNYYTDAFGFKFSEDSLSVGKSDLRDTVVLIGQSLDSFKWKKYEVEFVTGISYNYMTLGYLLSRDSSTIEQHFITESEKNDGTAYYSIKEIKIFELGNMKNDGDKPKEIQQKPSRKENQNVVNKIDSVYSKSNEILSKESMTENGNQNNGISKNNSAESQEQNNRTPKPGHVFQFDEVVDYQDLPKDFRDAVSKSSRKIIISDLYINFKSQIRYFDFCYQMDKVGDSLAIYSFPEGKLLYNSAEFLKEGNKKLIKVEMQESSDIVEIKIFSKRVGKIDIPSWRISCSSKNCPLAKKKRKGPEYDFYQNKRKK